jgi:hypothetical protein
MYGVMFGVMYGAMYGVMYGAMYGAMYGVMYGAMYGAMYGVMYGAMYGAMYGVLYGVISGLPPSFSTSPLHDPIPALSHVQTYLTSTPALRPHLYHVHTYTHFQGSSIGKRTTTSRGWGGRFQRKSTPYHKGSAASPDSEVHGDGEPHGSGEPQKRVGFVDLPKEQEDVEGVAAGEKVSQAKEDEPKATEQINASSIQADEAMV